jgi:transcriptional regulator with XRE-family HTH domain
MGQREAVFGRCSPALREEMQAFLKHCRARIQPEDVGLGRVGRRRVAGLRREEVAELIGVSPTWYRLFENGVANAVSLRFLRAVCEALRLGDSERRYLYALCNVPFETGSGHERLDEHFEEFFARPHETPFALLDDSLSVVSHNALYARLRTLPDRPARSSNWNLASLVFESADARKLYIDWEQKADTVCAFLHMGLARNMPTVRSSVAKLRALPEFERRWSRYDVMDPADAAFGIGYRHPGAGVINTRTITLGLRNHHHLVIQKPLDGDSRERLHWLSMQ